MTKKINVSIWTEDNAFPTAPQKGIPLSEESFANMVDALLEDAEIGANIKNGEISGSVENIAYSHLGIKTHLLWTLEDE